ncbi:unnamed protein product [Dibothriocephalus latus]|uniref:Uncharacterized protein n=1 Tax=Dibothriocephalus latus TaxID=60516 RepID=A0A3P7NRF0_DIBLA|nr:unnamed protein product [Dibothriocephalus latus]
MCARRPWSLYVDWRGSTLIAICKTTSSRWFNVLPPATGTVAVPQPAASLPSSIPV